MLEIFSFLIIGLARPRKGTVLSEISAEGIAIETIVDRSGSMEAQMQYQGQKINRLEVVKNVLTDFIKGDGRDFEGRTGDMIGLITFAGYADTTCPLVLSHNALLEFLKKTDIVKIRSEDGTAIYPPTLKCEILRVSAHSVYIVKSRSYLISHPPFSFVFSFFRALKNLINPS